MDENIFDKRRLKTFSNCKDLVRCIVGTRDGVIVYNEKFRLDLETTCYKANICEKLQKELEQLKEIEKENQELKEKINNIKKIIIDNSYDELYDWFNELREERVIEIVNILDIKKHIEIDQEIEEIIEKYKEV